MASKLRFFRSRLKVQRRIYLLSAIFSFLILLGSLFSLGYVFWLDESNRPTSIAKKQIELMGLYEEVISVSDADVSEQAKCSAKETSVALVCEKDVKNQFDERREKRTSYFLLKNQLSDEGYIFDESTASFTENFSKEDAAYLKAEIENQKLSGWLKIIVGPVVLFVLAWINKSLLGQYVRYNDLLMVVEFFSNDNELAAAIAGNEKFAGLLFQTP